MTTPADLLREPEPKAKPSTVPTIRFDYPKLTTEQLVKAVQKDKPVWRSLDILQRESIEDAYRRKLSERYDMTPVPQPEFDSEDWHL